VSADHSFTTLGDGAWHFQAARWQTSSLLAVTKGEALVGDPSFTPEEISAIRAQADMRAGRTTHFLLTHSHFDHTCGIGFFPEASVIAGQETAAVIQRGDASAQLASAAAEWGMDWPTDLRVDRVVEAGVELSHGPFPILPVEAGGNTLDGTAYVLPNQKILMAGDFLGSVIYPFLEGPPSLARATCERLLSLFDRYEIKWVVAGHGPALTPAGARAIGEADVAYLDRLEATARATVASGASPAEALLEVYGVDPPRAISDDFGVYGQRVTNARYALKAAGLSLPMRDSVTWRLFDG